MVVERSSPGSPARPGSARLDSARPDSARLDSGGGNRHAGRVDESRQWVEFGRWLVEQREERGLRRRDAARRAKISEALWRDLETGRKEAIGGIRLLPNPSQDVLERVAGALELPVEDVLARVGRAKAGRRNLTPASDAPKIDDDLLSVKLRRLSERDRILLERLVDAMLEHEDR
jgi:transcriptional regulator with XRE-family HTH domain